MQDPLHPSNLGSSPVLNLFHGSSDAPFEYSSRATPDAPFDNRLMLLELEYVELSMWKQGFPRRRKVKSFGSNSGKTKSTKTPRSPLPPYLCRYFPLAEIKAATKNFKVAFIIGVGGFGNVYKGYIDGGANHVAIKQLRPESSQGAGSSRQKSSYAPNSTTAIWFHSLVTAPIMAR
ncbi:hypothetical protein FF1_005931 [Malus domestica]